MTVLYKYLNADGGLEMLKHHNLQFTNATKFNDPFDCHPALINFSNVPKEACKAWSADDKTALTLNPDIKIYQMEIDPKAFRLKEKQI